METKSFFSGSQLKWIAIFAMLLDHTAKIISFQPVMMQSVPFGVEEHPIIGFSQKIFPLFIMIGRLAFPLFCFLLVEGFTHTSNKKRYATRLFLFALISEIPFDLAFSHRLIDFESQNVFFTLFIGLMVIIGLEKFKAFSICNVMCSIIIVGIGIFLAEFLCVDYGGWIGILLIITLYLFKDLPLLKCIIGALVLLQNSLFGLIAFIPIYFYNGKRGKQWKYFFYWFYPVHLIVLFAIQQFVILPYYK